MGRLWFMSMLLEALSDIFLLVFGLVHTLFLAQIGVWVCTQMDLTVLASGNLTSSPQIASRLAANILATSI